MALAWTTILIILFLLPGLAFLMGAWFRERQSRELIRSTAIGEIGLTIWIALAIHLAVWALASIVFGFDVRSLLNPLLMNGLEVGTPIASAAVAAVRTCLIYLAVTTAFFFLLGWLLGRALRGLATHKWAYDLLGSVRKDEVFAYVVTTMKEGSRVLMYKGALKEFYLDPNGACAYLVLSAASRYFLVLDEQTVATTSSHKLFPPDQTRSYEYLLIEGRNIANILFETLSDVDRSREEEILTRAEAG